MKLIPLFGTVGAALLFAAGAVPFRGASRLRRRNVSNVSKVGGVWRFLRRRSSKFGGDGRKAGSTGDACVAGVRRARRHRL